jgi:agmatine/peptidylarginine deiminase
MTDHTLRLPAEWEPQSAVLIAWPHAGTDWAERLANVETTYTALAAAVTRFQPLIIVVPDADLHAHVETLLREHGVDRTRVRFVELPYDDTWLRDSGPITLSAGDDSYPAHRFPLHRLGRQVRFAAGRCPDRRAGRGRRVWQSRARRIDWALEGGAIESDGEGTVLTTWRCLVQRHPEQSREEMSAILRDGLHAERVLWLDHGYLEGDDTDAHIDTLARFAPANASCSRPATMPAIRITTNCNAWPTELAACAPAMASLPAAIRCRGRNRFSMKAAGWPRRTPTT